MAHAATQGGILQRNKRTEKSATIRKIGIVQTEGEKIKYPVFQAYSLSNLLGRIYKKINSIVKRNFHGHNDNCANQRYV